MWDGRDDRGQPVVTGPYFYRLRGPNCEQIRKMTFIEVNDTRAAGARPQRNRSPGNRQGDGSVFRRIGFDVSHRLDPHGVPQK